VIETNRTSVICSVCDWKQQKNCDSHWILSYDHVDCNPGSELHFFIGSTCYFKK